MNTLNYSFSTFFLVGACAAAALELLKFYEYRGKLSERKFKQILKSPLFWTSTLGLLFASGYFSWVLNAHKSEVRAVDLAVAGVGCRSIIRGLIAARVANKPLKLGRQSDELEIKDLYS